MKCRSCGTEIADKAIVCYRCGTGTTEPVRKPVAIPPARRPLPWVVLAMALIAIALGLWVAADASQYRFPMKMVAILLSIGGVVLVRVGLRR